MKKLSFIEGVDTKGNFVCRNWDYDISRLEKEDKSLKYPTLEDVRKKQPSSVVHEVILKEYLTGEDGMEIERLSVSLDENGDGIRNNQAYVLASSFRSISAWSYEEPLSFTSFIGFRMERASCLIFAIQKALQERETGDFL